MIHTFGDSHSRYGFRDISNILINELTTAGENPRLCYTFGNKKLELLNITPFLI
jgi:hypothetical protein